MTSAHTTRRLAALLAMDVVGYSQKMGKDEIDTLGQLKGLRVKVIDPAIAAHQGRVFKTMGDGFLAEFSSVVNALACAVHIQSKMQARNMTVAKDARLELRMGVHLGDILVEDDDLFGDGVNVAARIEALARPGGICVSGAVRDNVGNRLDLSFAPRGLHNLKNIAQPVQLFDVEMERATQPDGAIPAAKPTIAVLPFTNMSGDVEQEYFSDGITEDIITNLSRISALGVIARNTSFQFKDQHVDVPKVARQLNARFVLEGSVRKAASRVRITGQLIDGQTGEHLWAERYDRDLSDVFALQDEISETIARVLKLRLLPEEKATIAGRATTDPQTYKLYLMARHYSMMGSSRHQEAIVRICARAVERDETFAPAWALMAIAQSQQRLMGEENHDALRNAERALSLDPSLPEAHAAKARYLAGTGDFAAADAAVEIALQLDPDNFEAHRSAGRSTIAQHRFHDAIGHLERMAELDPSEFWGLGMLIHCYEMVGDTAMAQSAARRGLERIEALIKVQPDHGTALGFGVLALFALGETERATEWTERALLLEPDNQNMHYNLACAFCKAGLVEQTLELIAPMIATCGRDSLRWMNADKDLDNIREDARFQAMLAEASARLDGARA
jgi:adenylate cyclase